MQDLENDGTNRRAGKYKTESFIMQLYVSIVSSNSMSYQTVSSNAEK